MKAMKATLSNDFHGLEVTVRIPDEGWLSERTTKRVYRELCGIRGCQCGGIRGPQDGIPDGWCVYTDHPDQLRFDRVDQKPLILDGPGVAAGA